MEEDDEYCKMRMEGWNQRAIANLKAEQKRVQDECASLKEENEMLKKTLEKHSISTDLTPIEFIQKLIAIMPVCSVEMAEEMGEYLLVYARHNKRRGNNGFLR